MKKTLLTILLSFNFCFLFAQGGELVGEVMTAQALDDNFIEGKPFEKVEEKLPVWLGDYQGLYLVVDSVTLVGDYHLTLVGDKENTLYNLGYLEHQALWTLSHCYIYFENEKQLAFSCSTPGRGEEEVTLYSIEQAKIYRTVNVSQDADAEMAEEVKKMLEEGNPCEAISIMEGMGFLQNYLNLYISGCNAAKQAYQNAQENLKGKDKAAAYQELYCVISGLENLGAFSIEEIKSKEDYNQNEYASCMHFEDYVQMMYDLGELSEQTDQLTKAHYYLQHVLDLQPLHKNALKALGNTLWKQNKQQAAQVKYKLYCDLMKAEGKKKHIPKSLKQRLRKKVKKTG